MQLWLHNYLLLQRPLPDRHLLPFPVLPVHRFSVTLHLYPELRMYTFPSQKKQKSSMRSPLFPHQYWQEASSPPAIQDQPLPARSSHPRRELQPNFPFPEVKNRCLLLKAPAKRWKPHCSPPEAQISPPEAHCFPSKDRIPPPEAHRSHYLYWNRQEYHCHSPQRLMTAALHRCWPEPTTVQTLSPLTALQSKVSTLLSLTSYLPPKKHIIKNNYSTL